MTDDDRTAGLLRETLAERAGTVDDTPPAVPARSTPPRRARAPYLSVAAAALVAVVAVTGVAAWRSGRPAPAAPGPAPAPAPTIAVPAGWKPVASLGVQIYVPPDWKLAGTLNEECALQTSTVPLVSRPLGGATAQGCVGGRKGTLVAFRAAPREDETPGRRVLGDGRTQITWASPRGRAVVVASGPDGALLQRVIDTARPVDVDALGCATRAVRPGWDRPRAGLPPVRLPDDVGDVAGCVYVPTPDGDTLVASARFDADQHAALSAALTSAPAGKAPDVPQNCAPGLPEEAYAVLLVGTGSSPVMMHWSGCLDRYVATADAQSAVTERLLMTVMDTLRVGFGWNELPKG